MSSVTRLVALVLIRFVLSVRNQMGNYINHPEMGPHNKCEILLKYGAVEIENPTNLFGMPLTFQVCVVDNGYFEAAAVIEDEYELECFTDPNDYRPKRWFIVKKDVFEEHTDWAKWRKNQQGK